MSSWELLQKVGMPVDYLQELESFVASAKPHADVPAHIGDVFPFLQLVPISKGPFQVRYQVLLRPWIQVWMHALARELIGEVQEHVCVVSRISEQRNQRLDAASGPACHTTNRTRQMLLGFLLLN